jgi:hypothetical protein
MMYAHVRKFGVTQPQALLFGTRNVFMELNSADFDAVPSSPTTPLPASSSAPTLSSFIASMSRKWLVTNFYMILILSSGLSTEMTSAVETCSQEIFRQMGPQIFEIVKKEYESNSKLQYSIQQEQEKQQSRIYDRLQDYRIEIPVRTSSTIMIEDVTNVSPFSLLVKDFIKALRDIVATFVGMVKGWFSPKTSDLEGANSSGHLINVTLYSVFTIVAYTFVGMLAKNDMQLAGMFEAELPSVMFDL